MKENIANYNKSYNETVSIFIEQVLSSERIGNAGYIPLGDYKKIETVFSPNQNIILEEIHNELFSIDDLSEGERIVFSNLLFGVKTTYVLAGAMGAGKTALINFMYDLIKNKYKEYVKAIYLNFNKGFSSDAPVEDTILLYKTILSKQLTVFLRELMENYNLVDNFVLLLMNQSYIYYFNSDFISQTKKRSWTELLPVQKIDFLFEYIKENNQQIDGYLIALFEILEAIKVLLLENNVRLILFFDNIDRLDPICQIKILDDILSKNEISKIKTLIALRRSSYKRFVRNASYDYGYFHHYGPYPIRVLRRRLEYWKEHLNEEELMRSLDEKFKTSLIERIDYILSDIKKQNSYTKKFLHCLSGRSVRVGLDLAQRIFINNVFPYDQASDYDNNIARSLLVGIKRNIDPEDPLVLNIFQLPGYYYFSILQLRILQLLMQFRKKKHLMKFRYIIKVLNKIGYNDDDEIRSCFNNMLEVQMPLIWLDSIGHIESNEKMYLCDESINLTEAGYNYYKFLLIDLNYTQECLSSLEWEDFSKSDNYDTSIYERFDFLRKCLFEVHEIDTFQIKKYIEFNTKHQIENEIEKIELFSNRIIYNIVKIFLSITREHQITDDLEHYYLDWISLITICYNNSISIRCTSKISSVLDTMKKKIEQDNAT